MKNKNELYLAVLSIMLGISVLKLTEIFQLGNQLTNLLNDLKKPGLSVITIGVFLFVSGHIIFFVLVSIASIGIVRQLSNRGNNKNDLGSLVGMCIAILAISYLFVFGLIFYNISLKIS
jgi:hypothetical protein